jgi:2',3'-cyclic-nucleotide 2'-phosphodiesterase/3'-nucleotidase
MSRYSKIKFLLTVLAGAVLAGCSNKGPVEIEVVATTDIHGFIFDRDCLNGEERKGSMAKLATFLKGERKANRNVIYLDAGDYLQGSVEIYQDVSAQFTKGCVATEAFNLLGCEAVVMGNHDFAVGAMSYDRFFRTSTFPMLGANVYYDRPGDFMPPYTIIEKKGVKIAVMGFTTPVISYSIPRDRESVSTADIVESAQYWMPKLKERENPDVIIGLLHSGLAGGRMDNEGLYENSALRLAQEVPGFDLILFGHDHKAYSGKVADCNGDSVLLLNPGPFVEKVAVAKISATSNSATVDIEGGLEDITALEPDSRFLKKLSGWYDDVKHYTDSVIGVTQCPMEASGVLWRSSSIVDYVHQFQMGFNGADISLTSPVVTGSYFPAGEMTIRDVFNMYIYDNTMVSVMLKGSEVRNVLEYSAARFYNTVTDGNGGLLKKKAAGQDGGFMPQVPVKSFISAAGIDYEIDVTKPEGSRVRITGMSDGRPFDPDMMYRTTVNSFLYGNGESALFLANGITHKEMLERFNGSSMADIRFFMLTDMQLRNEMGTKVSVANRTNWKLVPEDIVSSCLAKDTVNFNIVPKQTSLKWD